MMINYNKLNVLFLDDTYAYIDIYRRDILEYLAEYDIDPMPDNIEDAALEMISADIETIKESIKNFDTKNNYKIYVAASLGLWRGVVHGHAVYNNLYDAIFNQAQDINILYFKDKRSALTLDASHHDGTNNFKFYKVVNGKRYAIKYNDLF